jgi:hypothetical protein
MMNNVVSSPTSPKYSPQKTLFSPPKSPSAPLKSPTKSPRDISCYSSPSKRSFQRYARSITKVLSPNIVSTAKKPPPRLAVLSSAPTLSPKVKLSERISYGLLPVTEEQRRTYVYVAYVLKYKQPSDSEELISVAAEIAKDVQMNTTVVHRMLRRAQNDADAIIKRKPGSGRASKLTQENEGLTAAALALNCGTTPRLAADICNAVNKKKMGDEFIDGVHTISRNTLIRTLRKYTDVYSHAILRRKTGSRNPGSDWAVARKVCSEMRLKQIEAGKLFMEGKLTFAEARDFALGAPPIFEDAIAYADESHTKAVLSGSAEHSGSNSRRQYRVAVDVSTGKLCRCCNRGQLPRRKVLVKPKYDNECRACYIVCAPKDYDNPDPNKRWERTGKFLEPFSYTNKTLKSKKQFDLCMKQAMERVRTLKRKGWEPYSNAPDPFVARYIISYKELKEKLNQQHLSNDDRTKYKELKQFYADNYPDLEIIENKLENKVLCDWEHEKLTCMLPHFAEKKGTKLVRLQLIFVIWCYI